ncbi:DUF805 domain-containing protein [Magnetospirillum aberrantis]|uniref:DUF805 domain-containing protein n=1 Tax=Magnetospirillum aberrantis SpK TaxID=908842 RepID=A0A7C9UWQ6_9PROT|nr:DUF805 domain-containing protein [Magnetospirillum aberrantis]NFV78635.1 DUF805 domain-containing protein [Magnetospirillum aberrantis SpK]
MTFGNAVSVCFSKFATFQGRAARSEYWYFTLFLVLANIVLTIIDAVTGIGVLALIFALATLVPSIAVSVRRLHDTDRPGWWYLLFFLPVIGAIVLLIWFSTKGTTGPNRFGDDPLGGGEIPAALEAQA